VFTGIVEGLGTVKSVVRRQGGLSIAVRASFPLDNLYIGDSICVSGACLTVVHFSNNTFDVDIAPETLSRTTLGRLSVGDLVNLERALRLGERLGGHLVTGHVDGIGTVRARRPAGNAISFSPISWSSFSSSSTNCSRVLILMFRFSHAFCIPASTFVRLNLSRLPSFLIRTRGNRSTRS